MTNTVSVNSQCSLVLLRPESSVRVRHPDGELSRSLDDLLALLARHGMSDLSRKRSVHHQQHFELFDVMHQTFLEPVRTHVLRFLVGAVTNVWHQILALVTTSNSVIDTLRFPPVRLELVISI